MLFVVDNITDMWFSDFDEKDTTPVGLRCRNLITFPAYPNVKVNGQAFGAALGSGLHINDSGSKQRASVKNPPLKISKRMEYRQLLEYQKFDDDIKSKLLKGFKYLQKKFQNKTTTKTMIINNNNNNNKTCTGIT